MKIVYLLFFLTFSVPVFAYIDPGTGSMLFSLLTGLAVTAFFFAKNLLLRIKAGFSPQKALAAMPITGRQRLVIFSEGKQYWNVFKPVVEELSARGIVCMYYSAGKDDPGLAFESPSVHTQFIGSGNEAYRFLNFLEAEVCLMTTPGLDVFQLKRSPGVQHYCHILHTLTDATTYRLFGIDYYDSVLLTGDYQKKDIRALERLRGLKEKTLEVVGCTYLDVFQAYLANSGRDSPLPRCVLVAPSWGENALLRRYGLRLLEPLAKSRFYIVIRPHPQTMITEKDSVDKLMIALKPYKNVEWNFDVENLDVLSRADLLISDFSGVIFDFAFLFNRPVIYPRFEFDKRPYDLSDIEDEAWTFRAIRVLGSPLEESDFAGIERTIDVALNKDRREIQLLKDEAWAFRGQADKRTVDFLESLLNSATSID
ncbi:MAG: CDP-glycerol glycerophosphotransferase family protein [Treponema sp.]|jgi:hypothetical protein|nr:CDP-glycerol glycerophosphotransferase family protein [Treponema sp.]